MLNGVEWGEFRLGDLFEISSTLSFNANMLTDGDEYDYVTRTSQNQGVLRGTGFVNSNNINPIGNWSLGLLQMDFFYRHKPWYAGQFVRKITPKIDIKGNSILFFQTILNMQKPKLKNVLVRHVDATFRNLRVKLPVTSMNTIDFYFIDKLIATLKAERLATLKAYLQTTGLADTQLTKEEYKALKEYKDIKFKDFGITSVFEVKNTNSILSEQIIANSGATPYLCASAENNSVSSYISYDERFLDTGNCIFIGGKTFEVTYQEKDFYSNDSHNLTLCLREKDKRIKKIQLYIATCVKKSLKHRYSWGNSVSSSKIKKDVIALPIICTNTIAFSKMSILISAIQKLVIKDVIRQTDHNIKAAENIVNSSIYSHVEDHGHVMAADFIQPYNEK